MQVLKKIAVFFVALGLFSCSSRLTDNRIQISDFKYDIIDYDTIKDKMAIEGTLNVGVLLPLSGRASEIGLGMQNAMFLAIEDLHNNKIMLNFYDTQSTQEGATLAMKKARDDGVSLVLGPLTSEEVMGVSKIALSSNIPVVSFTTSPQVLQKGIYSIGMLNGEQIERALSYASKEGRSRVVLLVPDNNSGLNVVKSALMSVQDKNISIVKVGFYNPNSMDFTSLVNSIVGDPENIDFDTVMIADGGNKLKSMVSMFAYNDIMSPAVLFMGTSAWDNTNLSKETILYNGVYPMVSKSYSNYFSDKYQKTYDELPKSIYSLAYDSVLLTSVLSSKDRDNLEAALTNSNGFIGVNGFFKILPTGQSRHSLDMYKVTSNGPKVIDRANKNVDYTENEIDIRYIPYEALPEFYGKNNSDILKWLYNN